MKDEIKEILNDTLEYLEGIDETRNTKILTINETNILLDYITNLQDRIKELEAINEEHRKINGELRKTINEAIEYLEYQIPQLDFEKDTKAKMLGSMALVLLKGSDE